MLQKIEKIYPNKFPERLLQIPCPPKQLFIEGTMPGEEFIFLTVVGSRKFSNYGKEVCQKLVAGLKGEKVVIVSGLALGIDSIAHKAALDHNIITIAIPGSGLDRSVLHPHSNVNLANEIVRRGGALISELEQKMPAGIHTFPSRNRIMAGLSSAILVIEAQEKSGTLITARLAVEYNRDLLAVPGAITSLNCNGTNRLIRQGATPITSNDDLREALGLNRKEGLSLQDLSELSPKELKILEILSIEALSKDDLIRESKIPINEINTALSIMEIKGLIKELGGKIERVI